MHQRLGGQTSSAGGVCVPHRAPVSRPQNADTHHPEVSHAQWYRVCPSSNNARSVSCTACIPVRTRFAQPLQLQQISNRSSYQRQTPAAGGWSSRHAAARIELSSSTPYALLRWLLRLYSDFASFSFFWYAAFSLLYRSLSLSAKSWNLRRVGEAAEQGQGR